VLTSSPLKAPLAEFPTPITSKLNLHQCVSLCLVCPLKQEHTSFSTPEAIKPLLQEFAYVFETSHRFPLVWPIAHTIDLIPSDTLVNAPKATQIEKQLTQLLESGHIQPNLSPCASHAIIIPKKDSFDGVWLLIIVPSTRPW